MLKKKLMKKMKLKKMMMKLNHEKMKIKVLMKLLKTIKKKKDHKIMKFIEI